MEAVVELARRIGYAFPISRVVLPGAVGIRQALPADFIEVFNVDIDVVITVAVIAAVIIPVVMVMIPVIVIIPVDAAENGIGCRDAQAEA